MSNDSINILVLHSMGDPSLAPVFLSKNLYLLRQHFPQHNYVYHDASLNLPSYISDSAWDAIILDVTFLTARWAGEDFFLARLKDYSFVANSSAFKIALPQDEYDCNILLDNWMCDWKVDVVYSVISSSWDVLYPRYSKQGTILLGYTGYIDESLIDRQSKAFLERSIDIGYRAKKLPPYFGRTGEVKWRIGELVDQQATELGFRTDIKLGDAATLFGDAWLEFLGNSRFTLGANSGSSLLDPTGVIQRSVRRYLRRFPEATFGEVEASVFPGQDGVELTAISPRVFEAALLGSAQILVRGDYSGVVLPNIHFIPIAADASDFDEVAGAMRDLDKVQKMIAQCREAILSVDALRARNRAAQLLSVFEHKIAPDGARMQCETARDLAQRYRIEMDQQYQKLWVRLRQKRQVHRVFSAVPGGMSLARMAKKVLKA
jgi:hypothetical protein